MVYVFAHVTGLRRMAKEPQKNREVLKYIEQDRGLVHLLSMPFIPREKRWSSMYKVEWVPKDFVPEAQCQKESSTGILSPMGNAN